MSLNLYLFSLIVFTITCNVNSLMFRSYLVPDQWDTWAFYNTNDNKYYAYYLIRNLPEYKGEGFGLATSDDTVHWTDYGQVWSNPMPHNESWEGTGTVWLNPYYNSTSKNESFQFIVNFSHANFSQKGNYQNISFAISYDLINWQSQINNIGWFDINTDYYNIPGRWDTIYLFKGINNSELFGAWTATPNSKYDNKTYKSLWGYGKTSDGLHWTALPPPQIIWGNTAPPASNGELGAIERFITNNNTIMYISMVGMNGNMWGFYSYSPNGPYYPQKVNFEILSGSCYYSRFFRGIDNNIILVTHQSMSNYKQYNKPITFIAPYKYADIDDEGIFRMKYWIGNDNMKGNELNMSTNDTLIDLSYIKPIKGVFIEGTVDFEQNDNNGILIEMKNNMFLCININKNGESFVSSNGKATDKECSKTSNSYQVDRGIEPPLISSFKLLLRYSMYEFYLNDILYYVEKLNSNQTGIIGTVLNSQDTVSFLGGWEMNLFINKTV